MSDRPDGIVTFLFTDIEGSTQLWERHPKAMAVALARHDHIIRTRIHSHNGLLFKTMGDSAHAVFSDPMTAVSASVDIQLAIMSEPWPTEIPSLRVRMAIHTGEPDSRDADYFGPEVNRVARLLAAGHGGQILLSQRTFESVREKLSPLSARSLGEHLLKDLSKPEHAFQLHADGLREDFPPLRSLNFAPNNLPRQLNAFVGRAAAVAELKSLISQNRLVTLKGPGGTGKTRLAVHTAAEMVEGFAEGMWFADLSTLSETGRVATAIAAAVTCATPDDTGVGKVVNALRGRRALLIVDNCEQVVSEAAAVIEGLIRQCPELRVIATSRVALRVPGEMLYDVPTLDVDSADGEALHLFEARATAAWPSFKITPDNRPQVEEICRRLDGHPLAIELVAARVRVLGLPQLLHRLTELLNLPGNSRTAADRQRTIGTTIDWSYRDLPPIEQTLLNRLSVFSGGATLEAIEHVCSADPLPPDEILGALASLVDKSLVTMRDRPDGSSRFGFLEIFSQFSRAKLASTGHAPEFHRRHLQWCIDLARGTAGGMWEKIGAVASLREEYPNLRAAIDFASTDDESVPDAMEMAGALAGFWPVCGYPKDASEAIVKLLTHRHASSRNAHRVSLLMAAGQLAVALDELTRAMPLYQEALQIAEELAEPALIAPAAYGLAEAARQKGHAKGAKNLYRLAQDLWNEMDFPAGLARTRIGLALCLDPSDDSRRPLLEKALSIARRINDTNAITLATTALEEEPTAV